MSNRGFQEPSVRRGKIAIYLPSLGGGGAERVMVTIANGFAAYGFIVDLVCAKAKGPYLDQVAHGVNVLDLRARRLITSLPGLVCYLRRERPAVMLSAMSHSNVIAVAACELSRTPIQLVLSERANFSMSRLHFRTSRAHLLPFLMRWAYPRANGIVAISEGVADDLAESIGLSRDRISVIYNPVVSSELIEKADAQLDQLLTASEEDLPIVLGVGRLTEQKGFDVLIRAFVKVREQKRCRLVVLGEGELRGELETLVNKLDLSSDVSLPGFVHDPFAWMRRASLFVLSSRWEGFGNVLVEAMTCGTPVVSTDCPSGPAEILEGGKWGKLVPVDDEEAMSKAILSTMAEVEHPDVISRARDFSLANAINGYLNVLGNFGGQS